MKAVTGVFRSKSEAQRTVAAMHALGLPEDRITLLTPGNAAELQSAPVVAAEQPGMGKAIGAVVGASAGLSGAPLIAALIPGVGPVVALGLLGGAILAAAGAVAGGKLENAMTEGIPEDELFVYEDALRKGRSVVIALVPDEDEAARFRKILKTEGAEAIDAAREQWWIGLRDAEKEHYSTISPGKNFSEDEQFFRRGFEAALHARMRCREYDQVLSEMSVQIEELEHQYPDAKVADAFTRGYQRGREHYEQLCKESKAA